MRKLLSLVALTIAFGQIASAQTAPPAPVVPPAPVAPVAPPPAPVPAPQVFAPIPPPEYTTDAGWLCRPGRKDACSLDQSVTVVAADGKRKIVKFRPDTELKFDCFYVYPTVSLDPSPNSDLNIGPEETRVAQAQAARFGAKCRVFAPLYRQVTLTALRDLMAGKATTADRKLAFDDIAAAWRTYLERDNNGRGVVLIGHSQGAGILKQLLAEVIEKDAAQRRNVIAAYLIGTNVAVPAGGDVGGDFQRFKLCKAMDQVGCVVTYMSFRADSPPPADSRFVSVPQAGMVAACVNPAALGGGKAVADAILGAQGAGLGSAPQGPWSSDNAPVATPFVSVPGLISTECVGTPKGGYLAVTVNANPGDARTDTITGDVVINGVILKDWGLHLIDMGVEMGNLVQLADYQAAAWRGAPYPPLKKK